MRDTVSPRRPSQVDVPDEDLLARDWQALHDLAAQVAQIAQLSPEPLATDIATFPARIADAQVPQRTLAVQGIEDIGAMMQTGLAALGVIAMRGGAGNAPALALWREFHEARGAVLRQAKVHATPG